MESSLGIKKEQESMSIYGMQTADHEDAMSLVVQAQNGTAMPSMSNGLVPITDEPQMDDGTQPDADTIKMFVGQIPRSWGEEQCRELFEQYGPVHQLNVLRDKATQSSKGCCFVTFYHRKDAIGAQSALHNIKVLPQMHHAVQMKPADSENRNERKLFVGMLNKKLQEGDVRQMFVNFGPIEDCTVLKDVEGKSKGCAFVTFATRTCAQNAIKHMHHSQTMEGCSMPLVVKFADTQKEKEAKKGQTVGPGVPAPAAAAPTGALNAAYLQMLQSQTALGGGNNLNSFLGTLGPQLAALGTLLQGGTSGTQNVLSLLGNVLASLGRLQDGQQQQQHIANSAGSSSVNLATLTALASALNAQQNGQDSAVQQQQQQQQHQQRMSMLELSQLMNGGCAAPDTNTATTSSLLALLSSMGSGQNCNGATGCYAVPSPAPVEWTIKTDPAAMCGYSPTAELFWSPPNGVFYRGMTASPKGGAPGSTTSPNLLMPNSQSNGNLITLTGNGASHPSPAQTHQAGLGGMDALQQAYSGIQQYAASFPQVGFAQQNVVAQQGVGKQTEGPDGSNLFIYHLPQEFNDNDLAQTFSAFGNVVSAKVFIDKQTNLSKCFGFVSYDNALSAQQAIQAMNGFQIGTKRLKVQLKRSKSDGKPYQHPAHSVAASAAM